MLKNEAGQKVTCQILALNGSEKTDGTVEVYVMIDGGAQAIGTEGSGLATHEGHGLWSYTPSAAETNGNDLAFTFVTATGADADTKTRHLEPLPMIGGRIDANIGSVAGGPELQAGGTGNQSYGE